MKSDEKNNSGGGGGGGGGGVPRVRIAVLGQINVGKSGK